MRLQWKQNFTPPTELYPSIEKEYKLYAGPKGRVVAARLKTYKKKVIVLCCLMGVEAVIIGCLASYIINVLNGG